MSRELSFIGCIERHERFANFRAKVVKDWKWWKCFFENYEIKTYWMTTWWFGIFCSLYFWETFYKSGKFLKFRTNTNYHARQRWKKSVRLWQKVFPSACTFCARFKFTSNRQWRLSSLNRRDVDSTYQSCLWNA